jgi:threonine dehydrogenase-like Zn-dependent dehydrogenase
MKAAVLSEYGKFSWDEVTTPEYKADEVLVRIEYASICGSDQHVFSGDFHPRTPVPFIPGHEFAGKIVKAGSEVKSFAAGDQVAVDPIIWCGKCPACQRGHYPACTSLKLLGIDLDGGFAEYVAVPEKMLYKVADTVNPLHAALTEVLSIGFHAINRAGVTETDTIAIYGTGKVGNCILQAAKTRTNGQIFMVDIIGSRLKRAKDAYPDIITIDASVENPVEHIMRETGNIGVDVAFESVGHATLVNGNLHPVRQCIQSIRGAGTVCTLGLADDPAPLVMKELIWKEAKIIASRVSHGEFKEAIAHLEKGDLKPDALISDVIDASEVQKGFTMLEEDPQNHLKVMLKL